jgi:hypothetical protein
VQSSEDEIQVEDFPSVASPSQHARLAMHSSSSTPALPTHLARESEGADDNANYAQGRSAGAVYNNHLSVLQISCALSGVLGAVHERKAALCMCSTTPSIPTDSRYGFGWA